MTKIDEEYTDISGREYAKYSELKPGDMVQVDGDFTCLSDGACREVKSDDVGLYIECSEGKHYLDGQLIEKDNDHLIGIYPVWSN